MIDITQSIIDTLRSHCPEVENVYRNRQEQNFAENSFFVKQITTSAKDQFFNHQFRRYRYGVKFFPELYPKGKSQKLEQKCEVMAEKLMELRYLSDKTGIFFDKEYSITDGELLFKFTIALRVKFEDDDNDEYMEILYQEGKTK